MNFAVDTFVDPAFIFFTKFRQHDDGLVVSNVRFVTGFKYWSNSDECADIRKVQDLRSKLTIK